MAYLLRKIADQYDLHLPDYMKRWGLIALVSLNLAAGTLATLGAINYFG